MSFPNWHNCCAYVCVFQLLPLCSVPTKSSAKRHVKGHHVAVPSVKAFVCLCVCDVDAVFALRVCCVYLSIPSSEEFKSWLNKNISIKPVLHNAAQSIIYSTFWTNFPWPQATCWCLMYVWVYICNCQHSHFLIGYGCKCVGAGAEGGKKKKQARMNTKAGLITSSTL